MTGRVAAAAAAAAVAAAILPAWAVQTEGVDSRRVRELAARALEDPSALGVLEGIDAIDGVPADLERALGGASAHARRARLRALAAAGSARVDPDRARERAARILADARIGTTSTWPERVRRAIAGVLDDVLGPVARRVAGFELWTAAVAALIGAALWTAIVSIRRTSTAGVVRASSAPRSGAPAPEDLERAADAAERGGDYAASVRLRFSAGLMLLDAAGVIDYRPSLTSREIGASIRSPAFMAVAAAFDEIVYGDRPAVVDDAAAARRQWARVRAEVA